MHSCCLIPPSSQNGSHSNGLLANSNRFCKLTQQEISCGNVNKENVVTRKHVPVLLLVWFEDMVNVKMLPMNLHSRVNKQRLETKWRHSFFLRPGRHQRSFTCRAMYHAPILRRDIWDNCFVEVTGPGLASCPPPRSPQADSMVLFGAFCNFLCTKKKKKTCSKMTWMNVFLFMYMKMKRYRSVNRDVFCAGKDGV